MKPRHCHGLLLLLTSCLMAGCATGHSLRVTATAYTLNETPNEVGAWGDELDPDDEVIAVSRDLVAAGLTRGTKVYIEELDDTYVVRDTMAARWHRRIDILMDDTDDALQWGKRKVTIRWETDD